MIVNSSFRKSIPNDNYRLTLKLERARVELRLDLELVIDGGVVLGLDDTHLLHFLFCDFRFL